VALRADGTTADSAVAGLGSAAGAVLGVEARLAAALGGTVIAALAVGAGAAAVGLTSIRFRILAVMR
jgi:hypothetical protein